MIGMPMNQPVSWHGGRSFFGLAHMSPRRIFGLLGRFEICRIIDEGYVHLYIDGTRIPKSSQI